MTRFAAMVVVLGAVLVALAACGSTTDFKAAADVVSNGRLADTNLRNAARYGHVVNLSASDLPATEWEVLANTHTVHHTVRHGILLSLCGAEPTQARGPAATAVLSPVLTLREHRSGGALAALHGANVSSRVYVRGNKRLAESDLTAARKCVSRLLAHNGVSPFDPGGVDRPLTASLPGAAVAEVRLVEPVSKHPEEHPAEHHCYSDTLAFIVGVAEVELGVSACYTPLPANLEQQLLTLLYSRATTTQPLARV